MQKSVDTAEGSDQKTVKKTKQSKANKKEPVETGVVAHAYNPSTWEAEAGGCCEFETSLGYKSEPKASLRYIARPCLKKTKNK